MIRTSFAAAHCLIHYQGECENLHGHNWKVEVSVLARELDKAGLGASAKSRLPGVTSIRQNEGEVEISVSQ